MERRSFKVYTKVGKNNWKDLVFEVNTNVWEKNWKVLFKVNEKSMRYSPRVQKIEHEILKDIIFSPYLKQNLCDRKN